jgi:tetratricopeptide (TPR) repeat protein
MLMDPFQRVIESLKSGGVNIELTRPTQNGILEPVKPKELKTLGTKAKIASVAQALQNLTKAEKFEWAIETKLEGNQLFRDQNYKEAMEKYVEALTAADFGLCKDSSDDNVDILVIPVLCNLSACSMRLRQWQQAISFCDQILNLRPQCTKAQYRKGKALLAVGEYILSKKSLRAAMELSELSNEDQAVILSAQESATIPFLLEKANQGIQKDRVSNDSFRMSMQKAFHNESVKQSAVILDESKNIGAQRRMTILEFFILLIKMLIAFMLRIAGVQSITKNIL